MLLEEQQLEKNLTVFVPDLNEICLCSCHCPNRPTLHFMTCCNKCPNCNKNIRTFKYHQHLENCTKTDQK